ncbi:sigma-70 family RNA polymerase sigma factor [Streptomyces sp. NPDC091204]|uniref:RNA polymerase sigma factor n=1 Tax=Streptomyces sp. NPDC091204 TaxID=3155299 RepID=UPI003442BA63
MSPAPGHWSAREERRFREFHEAFGSKFARYAERQLGNRFDAEDAVHITFEVVVRIWPQVVAMEYPASYAWRVLKNRIADVLRERARVSPVEDDRLAEELDRQVLGTDPAERAAVRLSVEEALRRLPERQREAVVLHRMVGMSTEETAEVMGVKEDSVRIHLKRAKARLTRLLRDDAERRRQG